MIEKPPAHLNVNFSKYVYVEFWRLRFCFPCKVHQYRSDSVFVDTQDLGGHPWPWGRALKLRELPQYENDRFSVDLDETPSNGWVPRENSASETRSPVNSLSRGRSPRDTRINRTLRRAPAEFLERNEDVAEAFVKGDREPCSRAIIEHHRSIFQWIFEQKQHHVPYRNYFLENPKSRPTRKCNGSSYTLICVVVWEYCLGGFLRP